MCKFILVDEYIGGDLKGNPKYFKQMTGIGPASTKLQGRLLDDWGES